MRDQPTVSPEYQAAVAAVEAAQRVSDVAAVAAGVPPERHATPELRAAHARYEIACRAAGIIPAIPIWSVRDRPAS